MQITEATYQEIISQPHPYQYATGLYFRMANAGLIKEPYRVFMMELSKLYRLARMQKERTEAEVHENYLKRKEKLSNTADDFFKEFTGITKKEFRHLVQKESPKHQEEVCLSCSCKNLVNKT